MGHFGGLQSLVWVRFVSQVPPYFDSLWIVLSLVDVVGLPHDGHSDHSVHSLSSQLTVKKIIGRHIGKSYSIIILA